MALKKVGTLFLLLISTVFLPCGFAGSDYVLYLEQSPPQGGSVNPGGGQVHSYQPGEAVTLSATPAEGYEFVYWLGAVGDTATSTTTVTVDGPRYVIAVFERSEYDNPAEELTTYASAGNGGGGLKRSRGKVTYGAPNLGRGNANYGSPSYSLPDFDDGGDDNGDVVGPGGGGGDVPGPDPGDPDDPDQPDVPEPATLILLGSGAAGLMLRKRK